MKQVLFNVVMTTVFSLATVAAYADDAKLIRKLGEAQFTLLQAIAQAERVSGPALSGKFEIDNDALVYSVYTAPQGLDKMAEETELTELSGSATHVPMEVKTEVFTDKEHIARASSQLTVMQMSTLSLTGIVRKALAAQSGMAFDVKNPKVKDHRPVADVSILTPQGNVVIVTIDLISGKRI